MDSLIDPFSRKWDVDILHGYFAPMKVEFDESNKFPSSKESMLDEHKYH